MTATTVFLGIKGKVIAMERDTGSIRWATRLKGSDFVNVLVDGDRILATTKGEAFCLDASTGTLLWHNDLPGEGCGLITIATQNGSSGVAALREKQRQEEEAAASA